jgi:hypothetical protein
MDVEVRPGCFRPASPVGTAGPGGPPSGLFPAEYGSVSTEMSHVMYDRLGLVAPVIEIPALGHHVMLDQPIAFIAAIRTLLSGWAHSLPGKPTRPGTTPTA